MMIAYHFAMGVMMHIANWTVFCILIFLYSNSCSLYLYLFLSLEQVFVYKFIFYIDAFECIKNSILWICMFVMLIIPGSLSVYPIELWSKNKNKLLNDFRICFTLFFVFDVFFFIYFYHFIVYVLQQLRLPFFCTYVLVADSFLIVFFFSKSITFKRMTYKPAKITVCTTQRLNR